MNKQDITSITAEQAAFVLPRLAEIGFKPNKAGEIVTENASEFDKLQTAIVIALGRHERTRPQRRVVVVEGFKPQAPKLSPAATLARYGYNGEGVAFAVAGDHSLSLVRAAVRNLGGDWRLWASVEDDGGEGRPPRFRCVVGRADPWSYPSSVEAAGEVTERAITGADILAAHNAKVRAFHAAARVDLKPGTVNFLAPGEAAPKFDAPTPSAALAALLDAAHTAARAEGYTLAHALCAATNAPKPESA